MPAARLLHFDHRGPGGGQRLRRADPQAVARDPAPAFGDAAKERLLSRKPGGVYPGGQPLERGRADEQGGPGAVLIGFAALDGHGVLGGVQIGHIEGRDLTGAQQRIAGDGEDRRIPQPGQRTPVTRGECGGAVGLVPTHPDERAAAAVGTLAAEPGQGSLGEGTDGHGPAVESGRTS